MRLRWTEDAVADLQSISARIEGQRTRQLANRVCRRIYTAVQTLRRHPSQGRPGEIAETRELVIPGTPYIVVYRLRSDAVELLRILHGAQQWPPAI